MSVRGKVSVELGVLAVLTLIFLLLFPRRPPAVDMGLASFALVGLLLSARYTKNVIWAATPPPVPEPRFRRCVTVTLWITVPVVVVFLSIGVALGYRSGGWAGAMARILNWRILAAFGCYLVWALVQQTLFQFYLLGRLLALFPKKHPMVPVIVTGTAFSLVHLPDFWTSLATVPAGIVWCFLYYRYRCLLPLAFSHAALGSAFYYGLFGQDLAAEWRSILP
jgi:hypothetical protein